MNMFYELTHIFQLEEAYRREQLVLDIKRLHAPHGLVEIRSRHPDTYDAILAMTLMFPKSRGVWTNEVGDLTSSFFRLVPRVTIRFDEEGKRAEVEINGRCVPHVLVFYNP